MRDALQKYRGFLLACVAARAVGVGCSAAPPLEEVERLLAKGDTLRAVAILDGVASNGESSAPDKLEMGKLYARAERPMQAVPILSQAAREAVGPESAQAWTALGRLFEHQGQPAQAFAAYRRAVAVDSLSESLAAMGLLAARTGRFSEATTFLRKAIDRTPRQPKLWNNLGLVRVYAGDLEGAVEAFAEAVRIRPDLLEAHFNAGMAYGRMGQVERVVETFEHLCELAPDAPGAHTQLARGYLKLGRHKEALEALLVELRREPVAAEALYFLGLTHMELGELDSAAAALTRSTSVDSSRFEAFTSLGHVRSRLGQTVQAEAAYRWAIRLRPGEPEAHYGLGNLYLMTGRREAAIGELETFERLQKQAFVRQSADVRRRGSF